jgi:hypothetical protein
VKNRLFEAWLKFKERKTPPLSKGSDMAKPKSFGLVPDAGAPKASANSVCEAGAIVDKVLSFLKRFVFLKDESLYLLVAVWIITTYLAQEFDYMGYLFAYSPEPQSGKTTLLDVLNLLVANPSGIQISPTPAILFRTANGKTQLLDEIDTWVNHDDLRSVLNAGFQKGAKVSRMDKDPKTGLKAQEFPVYGPKALAGIGFNKLTRATRDRTFAISMVRQKKVEKRERFKLRLVKPGADALKKRIEEWAVQKRDAVIRIYNDPKFPYLEQFGDRTMDIADPLAAVVEVAFEGDSLVEAQAKLVRAIRETRNEQHSQTADHKLLRHLLSLAKVEDPLIGTPSELAKMCANLAETPNEFALGHVLRNYGFQPKSIRKPGEDPKCRYVLRQGGLQEVVDRWAGEPEEEVGVAEAPENGSLPNVVDVVAPQGEDPGQVGEKVH